MWQRFTERARKVVFYAQEEARRFGENWVGDEHLLLGLVREADSVAARVLARMSVDIGRIRSEIEKRLPRGKEARFEDMTLTPIAKRVIDLAYDEAARLNNDYIGTEHLLLGLIREREGMAATVLSQVGVDLDRARQTVIEVHQGTTTTPQAGRRFLSENTEGRHAQVADRSKSALIVVDIQDTFLAPIEEKAYVIQRSCFLIEMAKLLNIPVLATEQYTTRMGPTNQLVLSALPEGTVRHDKLCFSSCASEDFMQQFTSTSATQAVLVGIETHICVTQTALDLIRSGTSVFVCADATASRLPGAKEIALARIRDSGGIITHTESVAYEWLKQAGTQEFKAALDIVKRYA